MVATEPELWAAKTTAQRLSISDRKLWSLTASGQMPCVRVGRRVLYDPTDLRDWIDNLKNASL